MIMKAAYEVVLEDLIIPYKAALKIVDFKCLDFNEIKGITIHLDNSRDNPEILIGFKEDHIIISSFTTFDLRIFYYVEPLLFEKVHKFFDELLELLTVNQEYSNGTTHRSDGATV